MDQTDTTTIPRHSIVGAPEVSRLVRCSESGQLEVARRRANGLAYWRYRQPRPMLLWMNNQLRGYRLDIGGQLSSENRPSSLGMFLVPAYTTVECEFRFEGEFGYTLLFFNDTPRVDPLRRCLEQPLSGLTASDLKKSIVAFAREAVLNDNLFDVLSESWITQTLAYLTRAAGHSSQPAKNYGGLTAANSRRTEEYLRAHFAEKIRISDLAEMTGLGPRHFMRAFRQSFHDTPMQFILGLRVEEARRRLASSPESVTMVALDCGFSDAQHFSTTFRKMVGTSPSEYRRMVQG